MVSMKIQPGFHETMDFLTRNQIPKGILTRNNLAPVRHLIDHTGVTFDKVVSRDCFSPSKPAPEPLLHICVDTWGLAPHSTMMVGDHLDDLRCGRDAGCVTALLRNPGNAAFEPEADLVLESLGDLLPLLQNGFQLRNRGQEARL